MRLSSIRCCIRARIVFALVACALTAATPAAQSAAPPAQNKDNELDRFMQRVLARREVNRQTLQQYILDEAEEVEVLGPSRTPVYRTKRDFTWYVRDGMHVRSPVRFDGVAVGDRDRQQYEEDWIRRERERIKRRDRRRADSAEPEKDASNPPADAVQTEQGADKAIATPRFVSEAYFMDFKFEPGNYYLAGREQLEGKDVLRIEYYPQHMFNDDEEDKRNADDSTNKKRQERRSAKEQRTEQEIERKMNKTALVTLWVDPSEHQIVKYTFDNIWMDFLPAAWLVRVDDIRASMTMGQPFPGVWLPRGMHIHAGVSLANGSFEGTYARAFSDYRQADVKTSIRVPKEVRVERDRTDWISQVDESAESADAGLAERIGDVEDESREMIEPVQSAADQVRPTEVVNEIRVHGNAAVPDADIIRLAGVVVGEPLPPDALAAIERRLKESGRFESVEVRKRYRSLTDTNDVALVLIVHERPGVTSVASGNPASRPFHWLTSRLMFLPIVGYSDGYGFTYGGRVSTLDLLGLGERLSVPLTWGGTKRAALEFERVFKQGPLTRVESSVAIWNRENPHFRIDDQRVELRGRIERQFAGIVRTGAETSRSSVEFGTLRDHLWTAGADVALDTRGDPAFPRNAVFLGTGWTALHVRGREERINRHTTDARGYVGVIGQSVLAGRVQFTAADAVLPPYERLLLGGAPTLRGFRAGAFDGDRMLVTSAELRVPISSVLSGARLGLTGFFDAGKAYDVGSHLRDVPWRRSIGAGVFLIASVVRINVDVAHGWKDGDTRVHLSGGFGF